MPRSCRYSQIVAVAFVMALGQATPVLAQTASPPAEESGRGRLIAWLTGVAHDQTGARRQEIASLTTADAARERQVKVRTLLSELTGFEPVTGPVISVSSGLVQEDGFKIDRIRYQSLPGYWVTADVLIPEGIPPYPAIIIQPGHGVDGKIGNHGFAASLARTGFVVLNIDIVGEGERIQHYDPEIGASKVGRPTGEHSMAFGQSLPTGGHVSRYFIQDAMRGVDYLVSRPDVDDRRIGAFGCSGGGTITAYLAAFDPRIKATAAACYPNDFDHLLAPGGPGPQDAEQSIPFFLERGLDLPDWIEAAAPRPYAVVSTTEDMFPIAGARAAYAEARRFYGLMGAEDRIVMIEGPGGHGALGPVRSQIMAFFARWLKDDPSGVAVDTATVGDPARLLVTPTGQLSTSIGGETIQTLARAEADRVRPRVLSAETSADRLARLRVAVVDIARVTVRPGEAPPIGSVGPRVSHDGYGAMPVSFEMAPGMVVKASFASADNATGPRPTLLLLADPSSGSISDLTKSWTEAGWNVLILEPRGAGGTEEAKSPLTGDWTLLSLRALLVGRTPVGLRTDDALAAVNWLATRADVDMTRLSIRGTGALGPVALHAAVLDDRIDHVTIDGSILNYRQFADRPISRDMAEVNLPGVLARYDLPDLISVLADRLTLSNPINSIGETLTAAQVEAIAPGVPVVFQSARDPVIAPVIPSPSSRQ